MSDVNEGKKMFITALVSNVGKYMALLRAKTSILYAFGRAPKSDTLMVNPRPFSRPFSRPIVVGRLFRDTLGCGLTRCHRQQSTMTTTTTTTTMTMTTTTTTMLLSSSKGTNANNTNKHQGRENDHFERGKTVTIYSQQ
ncbi:hypothetical protein V1477_019160 [Vespula maculifrons]|uniref:Uncharacterized protein n=1 Tax=Vespula maculifrons TaxID=7453 RepID=A0ABD2ARR9_VESMC